VAISEEAIGDPQNGLSPGAKLSFAGHALCEAFAWKPDLVIATHVAVGPIAQTIAMLARRRYWIVVHGIESWGTLSTLKRSALRRANRVIVTNSFNQLQVVQRQGVYYRRTAILPCTLDETLLQVEPRNNGYGHRIPRGAPVLLTVGRMAASERYKGHDVVLRSLPAVLAKFPAATYVIAGEGDDRPRLERLANEVQIAERVLFTGKVSDAELAALYRRSNVFVLPARTVFDDHAPKGEGFGIVFLEAMAFGKPVIGPNSGAPAGLIRQGETGLLVDPEDPACVAEALLQLLAQPRLAEQMGHTGSEWVKANYSYAHLRQRLSELIADC